MIQKVKKTVFPRKPSSKKRQGGPGLYQVVQCGTAGHNIRSKPGMRGTPVGRLAKGNKIEALEEVMYMYMYMYILTYMYIYFLHTCIYCITQCIVCITCTVYIHVHV